jgi:hypothetical protein
MPHPEKTEQDIQQQRENAIISDGERLQNNSKQRGAVRVASKSGPTGSNVAGSARRSASILKL